MELPFAPPGMKTLLQGRDVVAAHFEMATKLIEFSTMSDVVTPETGDPEVVIVEFAGSGKGLTTGEPYDQRYISVIRVRDGYIAHYKDYWNPIAVLRIIKGAEVLKAFAVD
jgi:ketosteroid isomerase-like protein